MFRLAEYIADGENTAISSMRLGRSIVLCLRQGVLRLVIYVY
jgi:hypothetical protein